MNGYTRDQAVDALMTIPATVPHDIRTKIGMAARDAGVTLDEYDTWQLQNPRYKKDEVRAMWDSYGDGAVGTGTLFHFAKEHSWKPDRTARPQQPQKPVKPAPEKEVRPNPSIEVWARLEPVVTHGYATKKKLSADTLKLCRVVPANDPLTHRRGWLATPGRDIEGNLVTIEFVDPNAKPGDPKPALKDSKKSGAMFFVGADKGSIFVCEGLATADAIYQSTGELAVSTFGSGNTRNVVSELRTKHPEKRIVICPDTSKESDAKKIADEFHCAVAAMPDGWEKNSDLNDVFCADDGGFDKVQDILYAAEEPSAPSAPTSLLRDVDVFDVISKPSPPPAFAWDGYLPKGVVSLMGAHGGVGKSTVSLMLAVCTALGRPLFGASTEPCKVLFYSAEDGANVMRHRLAAICRAWQIDPATLRGRLRIVDATEYPELFTVENNGSCAVTQSYLELKEIVQTLGAGLVVIDNASDAYGGDEIKRRQVRAFMRSLGSLAKHSDSAVLMLMHVDKTTSRNKKSEGGEGYSGSTAWHNSARSRLFLTRGDDGLLILEHQKSNFGKMRDPISLSWVDGGFPQLIEQGAGQGAGQGAQGRADDVRAISLLKLIAEFEGRDQFCSPGLAARNRVFALLRSEPDFQNLKLNSDATNRLVNQCQRAKWIEPIEYKRDRKLSTRWTLTTDGRAIAGLRSLEPDHADQ